MEFKAVPIQTLSFQEHTAGVDMQHYLLRIG